jgi:hypothetical protein
VADVTGDGRPEVVVVCSSTRHMDMGHAAVLSPGGRTLAERSDLGGLYGITVADFNGDGADEIVTGGPDGTVIMLDGALEVVGSYSDTAYFMGVPNWYSSRDTVPDIREAELEQLTRRVIPLASLDVDGDGDIEVIGLSTAFAHVRWRAHRRATLRPPRGDLIVLDSNLTEEARAIVRRGQFGDSDVPFDAPASLKLNMYPVDLDGDGARELLLSNRGRGLFVFGVQPAGSGGQ